MNPSRVKLRALFYVWEKRSPLPPPRREQGHGLGGAGSPHPQEGSHAEAKTDPWKRLTEYRDITCSPEKIGEFLEQINPWTGSTPGCFSCMS